jgi:hypothetical protein
MFAASVTHSIVQSFLLFLTENQLENWQKQLEEIAKRSTAGGRAKCW